MKTLFFSLLFICVSVVGYAQKCIAVADSFIQESRYEISGTVEIIEGEDEQRYLDVKSDFFTSAGPDLYFILLKDNESASGKTAGADYYLLEDSVFESRDIKGPFTIAIPDSVKLENYNYLAVQCKAFGFVHWGGSTLKECKVTTSTNMLQEIEGISIYPVPVESILNVDITNSDVVSYEVYDVTGSKILEYNASIKSFFVTDLQPGVYSIKFNLKNNQFHTKRFTVK